MTSPHISHIQVTAGRLHGYKNRAKIIVFVHEFQQSFLGGGGVGGASQDILTFRVIVNSGTLVFPASYV